MLQMNHLSNANESSPVTVRRDKVKVRSGDTVADTRVIRTVYKDRK